MSRTDLRLRLFHHAALGLASVCLLYAEAFFLPRPLLVVLYLLAGLQILSFAADGGRWVLPAWAANLLAGAVAGGGSAWVVLELYSPDSILSDLPMPAGLLPYVGPVLIALLVLKLFRPRTARDFWLLQGVGALQVALASVLVNVPDSGLLFALLLAGYVAAALGCLALHYFERERGASAAPPPSVRPPFAYRMAPFCLRWTVATAAVAAPLFLLTPRIDGPGWDSSTLAGAAPHGRDTGGGRRFAESIDLTRAGAVQLGGEEVFRVSVEAPSGSPPPELPEGQRWRAGVLDTYAQGRWVNTEAATQQPDLMGRPPQAVPPAIPGRGRLDFTVEGYSGALYLAEPVRTGGPPDRRTRVESGGRGVPKPQVVSSRGPVLPLLTGDPRGHHYRQTVDADDDPDRTPGDDFILYVDVLRRQPVAGLDDWTDALLKRLAADPVYGLRPADVRPADTASTPPVPPQPAGSTPPEPPRPPASPRRPPAESWERLGRALEAYLARSGEYVYSLDRRRQNADLDPVMDFLVNVKSGHCERFASALALMLRTRGIPTRLVIGFRGQGMRMPDGSYSIRENQAHAWVEMRVPAPGHGPEPPPGQPRPQRWDWLTLDPTPAADLPPPAPYTFWDWWEDGTRKGQELWGGLIVNYNADQQASLWATLQSPGVIAALGGVGLGLSALAGVAAVAWAGIRRRDGRRGGVTPASSGYSRLLALLARHGGPRPAAGRTPREFAEDARQFLSSLPAAATFADLPERIVDRLYRTRYGGRTLSAEEVADTEVRLDGLAAALALLPARQRRI